jgi:hypothetical protein
MYPTQCTANYASAMNSLFPRIMLLEIFFTMTTLAPYDPEIFSDPSPMATSVLSHF